MRGSKVRNVDRKVSQNGGSRVRNVDRKVWRELNRQYGTAIDALDHDGQAGGVGWLKKNWIVKIM